MNRFTVARIAGQVEELQEAGPPFLDYTGRSPLIARHVTDAGRAVEITAYVTQSEARTSELVAELAGLDADGHPIGVVTIVDTISGDARVCSPMVRLR